MTINPIAGYENAAVASVAFNQRNIKAFYADVQAGKYGTVSEDQSANPEVLVTNAETFPLYYFRRDLVKNARDAARAADELKNAKKFERMVASANPAAPKTPRVRTEPTATVEARNLTVARQNELIALGAANGFDLSVRHYAPRKVSTPTA